LVSKACSPPTPVHGPRGLCRRAAVSRQRCRQNWERVQCLRPGSLPELYFYPTPKSLLGRGCGGTSGAYPSFPGELAGRLDATRPVPASVLVAHPQTPVFSGPLESGSFPSAAYATDMPTLASLWRQEGSSDPSLPHEGVKALLWVIVITAHRKCSGDAQTTLSVRVVSQRLQDPRRPPREVETLVTATVPAPLCSVTAKTWSRPTQTGTRQAPSFFAAAAAGAQTPTTM